MRPPNLSGVWLSKCAIGTVLHVQTDYRLYRLERYHSGWHIIGHPYYCPNWTPCHVHGSTFGGSALKVGFVGVGMYLEFHTPPWPFDRGTITTSRVKSVRVLQ